MRRRANLTPAVDIDSNAIVSPHRAIDAIANARNAILHTTVTSIADVPSVTYLQLVHLAAWTTHLDHRSHSAD